MATRQITTKRTLPKECTQLMTLDDLVVESFEELQAYALAKP